MSVNVKRVRLMNPQRRRRKGTTRRVSAPARTRRTKSKPKHRRARRNPAAPTVLTLGYLNPGVKMRKPRRKKTTRRRTRRANPANPRVRMYRSRRPHRIRRRRNPSAARTATDMIKVGALALGGLVLTRQVPQAALGARNSGIVGYLANAATAIISAAIVQKVSNRENAQAVLIGGSLYTLERVMNEQLTPLGRALSLSGVGDASASGSLRGIRRAYFPWPVVKDRQGNPIIPQQIIDATLQQIPAPMPPSNGGMGRFAGRFS